MHLGGGNDPILFKTVLTQRMLSDVSVPDPFPRAVVSFCRVGCAAVSVVLFFRAAFVLLTVTRIGQVGTARPCARVSGFSGHDVLLHG